MGNVFLTRRKNIKFRDGTFVYRLRVYVHIDNIVMKASRLMGFSISNSKNVINDLTVQELFCSC